MLVEECQHCYDILYPCGQDFVTRWRPEDSQLVFCIHKSGVIGHRCDGGRLFEDIVDIMR